MNYETCYAQAQAVLSLLKHLH